MEIKLQVLVNGRWRTIQKTDDLDSVIANYSSMNCPRRIVEGNKVIKSHHG